MKNPFTLLGLLLLTFFYGNSNPLSNASIAVHPITTTEQLRANLYGFYPDSSLFIVDGTLSQYASYYSNNVDGQDARKMSNPGENFSLVRNNINLIIERRQTIQSTDTIFFKMWGMQKKSYQLEFVTNNLNHPGLVGFLEDSYLHTSTPINLNGTTENIISINNDTASSTMYRFRIIFKTNTLFALPITFTSVKAYEQNAHINVDWKTENEINMKQYVVERSVDGIVFTDMAQINKQNLSSNSYHWIDESPALGNNYYRIRGVELDAKIQYSEVMKVNADKKMQSISIFPNPATGNNMNLQMIHQQQGTYEIKLINSFGQILMSKSFKLAGSSSVINISPGKEIQKGIYILEINKPDGMRQAMTVVF